MINSIISIKFTGNQVWSLKTGRRSRILLVKGDEKFSIDLLRISFANLDVAN